MRALLLHLLLCWAAVNVVLSLVIAVVAGGQWAWRHLPAAPRRPATRPVGSRAP